MSHRSPLLILACFYTIATLCSEKPVDAQTWTMLPSPGILLNDLTVDEGGNVYAGGVERFSDPPVARVLVYRDGAWVSIDPQGFGLIGQLLFNRFEDAVYAYGPDPTFWYAVMSAFSNDSWTPLPLGAPRNGSMALDNAGLLYVAGSDVVYAPNYPLVVRFVNGSFVPYARLPWLIDSVVQIAFGAANTLYFIGTDQLLNGLVRVYDGSAWTSIDPHIGLIGTIAVSPAGVPYIGGTADPFFGPCNPGPCNPGRTHGTVSFHEGGVWTSIDPPGFGFVSELVFDDSGTLYAFGTSPPLTDSPNAQRVARAARRANGVWIPMDPPASFGFSWIYGATIDRTRGMLYVSDSTDRVAKVTIALSPEQKLAELIQFVSDIGVPHGLTTALSSKLNAAQSSLLAGNLAAARNQLNAFSNLVRAQSGKNIPPSLASTLIDRATEILA